MTRLVLFVPLYVLLIPVSSLVNALVPCLPDDKLMVESHLGYLPENYHCVSARLFHDGTTPVAIQTHPLGSGGSPRKRRKRQRQDGIDVRKSVRDQQEPELFTPFPTLYWLTNPDICAAIADLERQGYIKILEERLQTHPDWKQQLVASHEDYARQRWECLSLQQQECVLDFPGMKQMLRHSGIAGTNYLQQSDSSLASIKCLHAHYAHYRSNFDRKNAAARKKYINPVGQWTHELLMEQYPHVKL